MAAIPKFYGFAAIHSKRNDMKELEKALAYVNYHIDGMDVVHAVRILKEEPDMTIDDIDSALANEIYDLMEEYGEEHDLPEGWWLEYGDIKDMVMKLSEL